MGGDKIVNRPLQIGRWPGSGVYHRITHGTPLGLARELKVCGFPQADATEPQEELLTAAEVLDGNPLCNHLSVVMNDCEVQNELSRYGKERHLRRISVSEARQRYGAGTVSSSA